MANAFLANLEQLIFWGVCIPLVVPPINAFFSIFIHRRIRLYISGVASDPAPQNREMIVQVSNCPIFQSDQS
jgi:hypothetical protein